MKFHPYSEVFPLIEGADFDSLVADIKANGLREKIWLYDGKVVDGRNRFLACQKAKVTPQYREFKGNDAAALAFVWSINDQRRHLTASQRAMSASRYKELLSANLHSGDKADAASEILGVSRRSVFHADKVREEGSAALQRAVDKGVVSVSKAATVVDLPKSEQLAAARAKTEKQAEADVPDHWEPEEDEGAQLEQAEKDYSASIDRVMAADDKLAAAHSEIKRQAAEIASLKLSRNGFQNQCNELIRRYKGAQRTIERLEKKIAEEAA